MRLLIVALLFTLGYAASQMVGGRTPAEITPEVEELAWKAVAMKYNTESNSMFNSIVKQVLKVEKQVVSGILYHIEVLIEESTCEKRSGDALTVVNLKSCSARDGSPRELCTFSVWMQPWIQPEPMEIQQKGCNRYTGDALESFIQPNEIGVWHIFEQWRASHNVGYETKDEHLTRFRNFKANIKTIKQLQREEKGTARYGVNRFADMTLDEFKERVLTPNWVHNGYPTRVDRVDDSVYNDMPTEFDWRNHSAVTPVKNQGMCGSCWAFSVTGNIEGQWAIKKGALVPLSEQELVDCDKLDEGCNGGLPSNAYREIIRLGGLEGEKDYPYDGHDESCSLVQKDIKVYINDSVQISTNETEMAAWLFQNGPISIGINANAMMFYWGGIAHPWKLFCEPSTLNHGVLIVGYGVKGNKPYWIIKNSWGASWGEHGYYLLYRGAGVCGVNQMATSAVVL